MSGTGAANRQTSTRTSHVLGAAGHVAVRSLVVGPPLAATPLAATRAAVILAIPGQRPVSVVSCDAVRLPGSLVLPSPSSRLQLAQLGPGTPAQVGGGLIRVGDLTVQPTRWWATHSVRAARRIDFLDTAVATIDSFLAADPAADHWASERLRMRSGPFIDALRTAVTSWMSAPGRRATASAITHTAQTATGLLGLGPGLTPSGDDLVAAALVSLARLAPDTAPLVARLGEEIAPFALTHTTGISAALLSWAGAGEAAPEVVSLLDAVARGMDLHLGLQALLRVGHTSGRDLARGVSIGVSVVRTLLAAPQARVSA